MSVGLLERSRPEVAPSVDLRARDWYAAVGGGGIGEPADGFSAGRVVVAASESRGGLIVRAASSAEMPQCAAMGELGAVFEGLLFERAELVGRLGREAATAVSDAELALLAYRKWGEALASEIRGLYSLVLWDAPRQRLLAVRDRMGHRPLFFSLTEGELVLATSPGLVGRHPRVSRELDRAVMAELLCYRFLDPHETYFARIRRLPPGHQLGWSGGDVEVERYWSPRFGNDLDPRRDDIPALLDVALGRAVGRTLEAGPTAIFLSGGLDSANVALTATELCAARSGPPPLALSLAFPEEASEVEVQSGIAHDLGLEQLLVPFFEASGDRRTLLLATEMSRAWPSPQLSLWNPAYVRLGREGVSRGCRAILTGHGGDEYFDRGPELAADLIRSGSWRELRRLWRMARHSYPTSAYTMARNMFWRCGLRPMGVEATLKLLGEWGPRLAADRKRRVIRETTPGFVAPDPALRRELDERAERFLPGPRTGRVYRDRMPFNLTSKAATELHENSFETGRRIGAPILMPLLDPDLIELVLRIPSPEFFADGRSKGPLRVRVAERLPRLGYGSQKKQWATSFGHRLVREQTDGVWDHYRGTPALEKLGIVDSAKLRRALDDIVSGRVVWKANRSVFSLSLEAWTRSRD